VGYFGRTALVFIEAIALQLNYAEWNTIMRSLPGQEDTSKDLKTRPSP